MSQAPPVSPPAPPVEGLGRSARRPDAAAKVRGEFAFSGDAWAGGMLWGHTLRSPHPSARIRSVDVAAARSQGGVAAVLTAADVPGKLYHGLDADDQPALADGVVRYAGEPVALVAADHPDTARRAAGMIAVDYDVLEPVLDPAAALRAPAVHPAGNVVRHLTIARGDMAGEGPVAVEGTYEVGMQDQAFMGPEAALAVPAADGGVDLFTSSQWLHRDRDQVASCLGLAPELVRLTLGGVGGAFGAREDISLQVHVCLLALRTGRPVKMVYSRDESFLGHVHRHPARMWYRHTADPDGRLRTVEARILLDGGAYQSTSYFVAANAAAFSTGPYVVPAARIDTTVVRTNNPTCGAMRGFGAVQACVGHEAQMDRLAAACGVSPLQIRLRNALDHGGRMITGQRIDGVLPVARVLEATAAHPLPPVAAGGWGARPGGTGRSTDRAHIRRGVGWAVGYKNLMYAEGADDSSEATCTLLDGWATVRCAVAEVGQGWVTLAGQIARSILGAGGVTVAVADTSAGSAGSTSASRQTWVSGGALEAACRAVAARLLEHVAAATGARAGDLQLADGRVRGPGVDLPVAAAAPGVTFEETARYQARRTHPLDAHGQGDAHVSFACAAHRAVIDVDLELGLVRVVQIATAQDVGRALNPLSVVGQIEGGVAQGVGLAVMEELVLDGGTVRNASFTDYLIPTIVDMPPVLATLIEEPEPGAPFGAKGVGEPPTISSTAAVVAAIRDATGRPVNRIPVRPDDLVFG